VFFLATWVVEVNEEQHVDSDILETTLERWQFRGTMKLLMLSIAVLIGWSSLAGHLQTSCIEKMMGGLHGSQCKH